MQRLKCRTWKWREIVNIFNIVLLILCLVRTASMSCFFAFDFNVVNTTDGILNTLNNTSSLFVNDQTTTPAALSESFTAGVACGG